jgi:hypothetical protein
MYIVYCLKRVAHNIVVKNMIFQAVMERAARSRSLADLTSSAAGHSHTPGTTTAHLSLLDLSGNNQLAEESILHGGSPAGSPGCSGECDPSVLDVDSDSPGTEKEDELNIEGDKMLIDNVISDQHTSTIDPLYHQCKIARRMSFVDRLVSVTNDGTFGSVVTSPAPQIGHLTDHEGLVNTFCGARIQKGNVTVNQSVSLSFDPSNMSCISCNAEHKVVGSLPITVIFSDQNFVSNIEGSNGTCIAVVRQEDASLTDLFKLAQEIFENQRVPEGSVFLFGSASYLARVGTGTFAGDWLATVCRAEKQWRGIRVCPLIPLILSDCPGTLAREIAEIAAWFTSIYENNPLGLFNTWAAVVSASETLSDGGISLPHMDSYKISVLSSLSEQCTLSSMTFCSVSTRPATLRGLPKDKLSVLVRTLVETVHRCLQTCANPENFLERDPIAVASDNLEQKVVLLGASNLGCCAQRLRKRGKHVIDLTQPGWVASNENIDAMAEKLKNIECNEASTLVFDLFGNSSFRFEQFDGSLSMPFKHVGRYHLAGKIAVCPLPVYKRILENTAPVLTMHQSSKVVIVPPLPRYLFSGCCKQSGYSTNVSEPSHSNTLLSDTIGLRNHLKKFVVSIGIKRCQVMDSCCVADIPTTANTVSRLEALKNVCAQDGVHFTSEGYNNLVSSILKSDSLLSVNNKVTNTSTRNHFWRGFKSIRGSASVSANLRGSSRGGKFGRGGRFIRQFHPIAGGNEAHAVVLVIICM